MICSPVEGNSIKQKYWDVVCRLPRARMVMGISAEAPTVRWSRGANSVTQHTVSGKNGGIERRWRERCGALQLDIQFADHPVESDTGNAKLARSLGHVVSVGTQAGLDNVLFERRSRRL